MSIHSEAGQKVLTWLKGLSPFTTNIPLADIDLCAKLAAFIDTNGEPVPMILHCPECGYRHIDEGEFATKLHHTHACQACGLVWRPAKVNTIGVQFLPGFRNGE